MSEVQQNQSQSDVWDQLIDNGQIYEQQKIANRIHGAFGAIVVAVSEVLIRPEGQAFTATMGDVVGGTLVGIAWAKGMYNRIQFEEAEKRIRKGL